VGTTIRIHLRTEESLPDRAPAGGIGDAHGESGASLARTHDEA